MPKETVGVIPALLRYEEALWRIPLDKEPEDFVKDFVSLWYVDRDGMVEVYTRIINSSPVVREAFDQNKASIIQRGIDEYREELEYDKGDENEKHEVDEELAKRINLLNQI